MSLVLISDMFNFQSVLNGNNSNGRTVVAENKKDDGSHDEEINDDTIQEDDPLGDVSD